MSDLVSTLISAYYSSRWLSEFVGSALAQTWPRKEIVIGDDGSKDDALAEARRFEGPEVKVVTQVNAGAPGARNHTLGLAQGDYTQWLDADDFLHPQKIELQRAAGAQERSACTLLTSSWCRFSFRTANASFEPDSLWQDHSPIGWLLARFQSQRVDYPRRLVGAPPTRRLGQPRGIAFGVRTFASYFDASDAQFFAQRKRTATELDGELKPPSLGWKRARRSVPGRAEVRQGDDTQLARRQTYRKAQPGLVPLPGGRPETRHRIAAP